MDHTRRVYLASIPTNFNSNPSAAGRSASGVALGYYNITVITMYIPAVATLNQ